MSSEAPKQTRSSAKAANKRNSAAEKAGKAKKRRTIAKIGWIGGAALLIAAIAVAVANRPPKPGEKVEVMADQTHIATVTSPHKPYNSDPPTSGQHVPYIAPWGVHKEPLPKELLVHNLEDSGVVLYYSKEADPDTVEKLETIVKRYSKHVLVNPYPDMPNPIILTAWGRIDRLDGFDENRIVAFIDAYKGIDHHPRS